MPDQVIGIRFGVAGGDSISGESGREIKRQLDAIASQIQLKINIDKKHFQNQVNAMKAELEKTIGSSPINIRTDAIGSSSSTKIDNKKYKEIVDLIEKAKTQAKATFSILDTKSSIFGLRESKYQETIDKIRVGIKEIQSQGTDTSSLDNMFSKLKEVEKETIEIANARRQDKMSGGMETSFKGLIASVESLNERYSDLIAHNDEASKEMKRLQALANAPYEGVEHNTSEYQTLLNTIQLVEQEKDKLYQNDGVSLIDSEDIAKAKKLEDQLADLNTQKARLESEGKSVAPANFENASKQVRNLANATKEASARFSELEIKSDTLGKKLRQTLSSKIIQTISYALIGLATNAMRQVYDNIVKIDTSLTSLKIVTKATSSEIKDFTNTVMKSAQRIGKSVNDLIESTTVFARLGYSLRDATELAEKTTMYSNISGIAANEATTNITAIIKAFKVGADDIEDVLDKLIYVGNNYAISSGEIGEGMNNAASALSANGNTLEEAMGILAAANATVQNASKSSTGVRTIAARMSASITELEEMGESIDDVLSTAKLAEEMSAYGINILDANKNLRSTYDVLSDIAKVWDDIGKRENGLTQQKAIAGLLAGSRQQNVFFSMMQNWSDAESVVSNIADSYGALQKANEEYIDSIQGRINSLKATWESFSNGLINSTLFKGLIDILTLLAKAVNLVVDGTGGMLLVVGGLTAGIVFLIEKLQAYRLTLLENTVAETEAALSLKNGLLKVIQNQYVWLTVLAVAMTLITRHAKEWGKVIPGIIMLITSAVLLAIKTTRTAIASNWIVLAIAVVISAVYLLVDGIKELINTTQKAINKAKESKEAWEETVEDIEEVDSKIEQLTKRLGELMEISAAGKITLIEQEELDKTSHAIELLQTEKQLLEDLAKERKKDAERDAANAFNSILGETVTDAKRSGTTQWYNQVLRYLATELSFGISDALGYGVFNDNMSRGTKEEVVNSILNNWNSASQEDRDYAWQFYDAIKEQKDMLSYHSGDNLEQWEKDANAAYNKYYEYVHKFILTSGNGIDSIWNSILSMERFDGVKDKLKEIANAGNVTKESLADMYNTDSAFKSMIDYLQQLGLFSWNDASKIAGLVNQINAMSDAMANATSKLGFVDLLDKIQGKFDTLDKALSDIEKNGIISADTIKKLLQTYPSLEKYFKLTQNGYVLGDQYNNKESVMDVFGQEFLQPFVDNLSKCTEGTEEWSNAQENLNTAIAVFAMLMHSSATDSATKELENQKDVLEDQVDEYKKIIKIRKKLLETYEDEVSYQKTLAQKQKDVADLRTKLALARLDNSASGQASARKLEQQLESAKEDLDDYTLEHAIDSIINELDTQQAEYQDFIEKKLQEIEDAIDNIKTTVSVNVNVPSATKETNTTSSEGAESSETTTGSDIGSNAGLPSKTRWTSYADAAADGYANIAGASPSEKARVKNWDNPKTGKKYASYQEYLDVMYEKYIGRAPKYHTGGFVGEISSFRSNEVFAKLLKGEFVSTPEQMNNFISKTLPSIAKFQTEGATISYNSPLIEINCENVNDETIPRLRDIVDQAVDKIKREMNSALSRTGFRKQY